MSTVIFCDRCGKNTKGSAMFAQVEVGPKSRSLPSYGSSPKIVCADLCLTCRDALVRFFERQDVAA